MKFFFKKLKETSKTNSIRGGISASGVSFYRVVSAIQSSLETNKIACLRLCHVCVYVLYIYKCICVCNVFVDHLIFIQNFSSCKEHRSEKREKNTRYIDKYAMVIRKMERISTFGICVSFFTEKQPILILSSNRTLLQSILYIRICNLYECVFVLCVFFLFGS